MTSNLIWKGKAYSFHSDAELIRFATNMTLVENRQGAAKDHISEEMQLPQDVQNEYNNYLAERERHYEATDSNF